MTPPRRPVNRRDRHTICPVTGTGLKYRAHPLGLALALPQIRAVDQLIENRHKSASILMDALSSIPGIEFVRRSGPGIVHGHYALVALIDPDACGFGREDFTRAMHAENIHVVSIPRQMNSMSRYPASAQASPVDDSGRAAIGLEMSRRITAAAVKFFVPATGADLTAQTDVSVAAEAIYKVAGGLSRQH